MLGKTKNSIVPLNWDKKQEKFWDITSNFLFYLKANLKSII